MAHPDVLDIPETAALLSLSKSSTYRAVRAGEIPAWRLGSQWRLWRPAVLRAVGGDAVEDEHPMIPAEEPQVIDRAELATLLDITPQTCLTLIRQGLIPSRRVGGTYRIYWPSIRQMMIDGSNASDVGAHSSTGS